MAIFFLQHIRLPLPYLASCFIGIILAGCSYTGHIGIRAKLGDDQRKELINELEKQQPNEVDISIHQLTLGTVYRLDGNYQASIATWQQVKSTILQQRADSISEGVRSFIGNNTNESYTPNGTEEQMLYLLQAANYLHVGKIDGARVEVMQREQQIHEYPVDIPFPFIDYFAGMVFEITNEPDQALVSYRRSYQGYLQQDISPPQALLEDFARLLIYLDNPNELDALQQQTKQIFDDVIRPNLTIIVAHGLAPEKYEQRLVHFDPESKSSFTIALPAYQPYKAIHYEIPLQIHAISLSEKINQTTQLIAPQIVANVDAMERAELEKSKPSLLLQAVARQIAKRMASNKIRDERKSANTFENFLVTGPTEAFVLATESADLRSWNTMPSLLSIYRISLPSGRYTIQAPGGKNLPVHIENDTQILRLVHNPFA